MGMMNTSKVMMIAVVLVTTSFVILSVPVYAQGGTNGGNSDAYVCAHYFSPAQVYDLSTSTCTISGPVVLSIDSPRTVNFHTNIVVTNGGSLTIPQGDSFSILGSFTIGGNGQLLSGGKFDNIGSTTVQSSVQESTGYAVNSILNGDGGVFINHGTLSLSNSHDTFGFENYGRFVNHGTVTIDNTDTLASTYGLSFGFVNYAGTFTNYGTITISNTGFTVGLVNGHKALLNNYGTIDISSGLNSHAGLWNQNVFNNYGTVTITGCGGYEIYENGPAGVTINNYGTIIISNKASSSQIDTGIYIHAGDFYNYGSIYIWDATAEAYAGTITEVNGGSISYSSPP
jgi:hypothetical protein